MRRFSSLFFSFWLINTLLFCSCVAPAKTQNIRVYDENAYLRAKGMLQYDLTLQKIDTEILPSSNMLMSINPLNTLKGHSVAKKLYDRLDISFRMGNKADLLNQSFLWKDYVSQEAHVQMHAYGFTVAQGDELVTVTTLGELDWDNDGVMDYLVSFRINQKPLEVTLNTQKEPAHSVSAPPPQTAQIEMPTRDYTILIKNINAPIYKGEILIIHDYIKQSSGVRSLFFRDYKTAQDSFFQDHVSASFEAGQEEIVLPPEQNNTRQELREKNEKNSNNKRIGFTEEKQNSKTYDTSNDTSNVTKLSE